MGIHAGNIAVGNSQKYLPMIVKQVATASTPAGRLLFLHALREVCEINPPPFLC